MVESPHHPGMDRRRFLLTSLAGALAAPRTGEAQPKLTERTYMVGILTLGPASSRPGVWWQPFLEEMRHRGYVEGRNLVLTYRGADENASRLPDLAAEVVKANVDIIVTTGPRETLAAKRVTASIPIVFTVVHDPIREGVVKSLARPEANITGLTTLIPGLYQKYVELLREVVPSAATFALVGPPAGSQEARQEVENAGRALGIRIVLAPVSGPEDFDPALVHAKRDGAAGIIVLADAVTGSHRGQLVELAVKRRLPGIYWERSYVDAGGLMTYSANADALRRRAAQYVDRILKGAKPADLPVEQPTKFELIINLKTAKALGLTIPPSLLARADQVIE